MFSNSKNFFCFAGYPGNGAATKNLRRCKYSQQERLRQCGLRAIKQFYSGDLAEILAWRKENLDFPVIIKPALSAGTEGVYWCHTEEDVERAFAEDIAQTNMCGFKNF